MKRTLATICVTLTLLLGSSGISWSADFQKGLTAAESGDYATALREWTPLAEQGNTLAQFNLGVMYDNGRGVLQDYVRANMWFNIAASSGDSENASKNRDIVAKRMTPSQIETAQRLAQECVSKNYKGC